MKLSYLKTMVVAFTLCSVALSACGNKQAEGKQPHESTYSDTTISEQEMTVPTESQMTATEAKQIMPEGAPFYMVFSSGAGGWMTDLTIEADGTFSGSFHDSGMCPGENYEGTLDYCNFSGLFTDVKRVDEYTYELTLAELVTKDPIGKEEIKNGILHRAGTPYGMEGGKTFLLYTPDTPISVVDEAALSWWPGRFEDVPLVTLGVWGLCNVEQGQAFFSLN